MAFTEPVLTKRIPFEPEKRKTFWYDDYVAWSDLRQLSIVCSLEQDWYEIDGFHLPRTFWVLLRLPALLTLIPAHSWLILRLRF